MAFLQLVAFASFPYATLMMAGTTAVSALWYVARYGRTAWGKVAGFLALCALVDFAFALYGTGGLHLSYQDHTSMFKLQLAVAVQSIGKLWFATAILVVATAMTKRLRPEAKWPLVGMGLANILFILGDAIVSERVFFFGDHLGYFYQSTILILFIFLASAYLPSDANGLRVVRLVCLPVLGLCLTYGLLVARAGYRRNLPYTKELYDLARWFGRGEVSSHDLVITQFTGSQYDSCEWVPLLSDAEVLYCRNAQVTLTPEQNRNVQRPREVMYLYFVGRDHQWLEGTSQFEQYGLYGDVSTFRNGGELPSRIQALRAEMRPQFERIEHCDPSIQAFFRSFRRVWIIQSRQNPLFVNGRLASYLDLNQQESIGSLLVLSSHPK